jgi:hypothetical protein
VCLEADSAADADCGVRLRYPLRVCCHLANLACRA